MGEVCDVTMACEDANSKLVEVVTVADVDDEGRVGNLVCLPLSLTHCTDSLH